MTRVLIALDYGVSAQRIAAEGFALARKMNAGVTLLHVVADETYYDSMDAEPFLGFYGYDFFDAKDNEGLVVSSVNFLEKIKANLKEPAAEVLARQGDFASIILEVAEDTNAQVIVLGSHSKNWLERTVLGSVTESVMAQTKIPLYVVPIREN